MRPQKYGFKIILFMSILSIALFGGIFSFISQGDFKGNSNLNTALGEGVFPDFNMEYAIGDRSFSIGVNDSSLGALGATYQSTYKSWNSVNLIAVPNSEVVFIGWTDASKGYISSEATYKLKTSENYNITALFAKFGGNNTQSDPFTVGSVMDVFNTLSTNISVSLTLNRGAKQLYFGAIDGYTFAVNGNTLTATNGVYSITGNGAVNLAITNSSSKTLTISIVGQGLNNIIEGSGSSESPYIIYNQTQLMDIKLSPSSYFKLGSNITLSGTWTPLPAFSGNFNGNDYEINNLKITSGSNIGLFSSLSSASVYNFKLLNVDIHGSGNVGAIAGVITSSSLSNIEIEGNIAGNSMVGGFGGDVDKNSTFNNMTIKGNVINYHANNCSDVGGFAGRGGKYTECIMYANVEGNKTAGGFVGGYQVDSSFTRCYMAGSVHQRSGFDNNYPYIGIANGYGAWATYTMSNSGQRINVNYTSSKAVTQIDVFNASSSANGLSVTVPTELTNGKYNFTADAIFSGTNASLTDLFLKSEVNPNGIVCNFGGMTIRFKMSDGTYKYIGTLDRTTATFRSNFDLNLDELTSYVDNFSSMTFNTTENSNYKTEKYNSKNTSIFGTIEVGNANDFEHVAWIINGGIPTTFANGAYYINSRTGATMSIKLMADIDLTTERVVNIDGTDVYLNRVGGVKDGELIYNFYGLGNSEMMPYRGNIYGNNHTLKVYLNMPEAYNVGIIGASTEEKNEIQIKDLTIEGTIIGRDNVGIVGFFDSYERSSNIRFTNVVNKANITGTRWVGGFLGNGHEATVYFDGCTNYGSITGREYRRTDPVGIVENMASTDVGGFVGETYPSKSEFLVSVNFINKNKTYAPVNSPNAENTGFFIGACSTSTYVLTTGASNELYYTVDVKQAGITISINGTSYTSDENGIIYYNMGNVNRISELPVMNYTCALLNSSAVIPCNASTLYTELAVPTSIDFASSGNVYEVTSSSDNFVVNMTVGFSNNTSTAIQVSPKLSAEEVASNQLVFNNVEFNHATYKIPSTLTANLKRITSGVEDYVTKYNTLNNLPSKSADFQSKYTLAIDAYNALTSEFENYTSDDLTRFNDYISNTITNLHTVDASKTQLDVWANKIVDRVDVTNLENVKLDYGATSVSKDVSLIFMDGTSTSINVVFALNKRIGYLIYDGAGSAYEVKYNEKVTYTYNPTMQAEINPRELTGLSIGSVNTIYNGENVIPSVSVTNIEDGDEVVFILDYSGSNKAVNVGSYSVILKELSGKDGIYYSIPENQTAGSVVISKLTLSFSVNGNTEFTYNKQQQAPNIVGAIAIESDYTLTSSDYAINYVSANYNSQDKPVDVDEYTAVVSVSNNFAISGSSEFSFTINKKALTGVSIKNVNVDYVKDRPELDLTISNENGVESGDTVNVTAYNIFNSDGQIATTYNVASYYALVVSIDNPNYKFTNLRADFNIIPEVLDITIGSDSSVYGDAISLDKVTYSITSGILYTGDELNIELNKEQGVLVGDYDIDASYTNANYTVNFTKGNYSITVKTISLEFPEYNFTYNGKNQIDEIPEPTINNLVTGDVISFVVYSNGEITNMVKNAGDYKIAINEELEVLNNYTIVGETYKEFKVNKKALTIGVNALQQEYKEELSQDNFSSTIVGLEGDDKITDLGILVYNLTNNGNDVEISNELVVDDYEINVILSSQSEIANNYIITTTSNELDIVEGSTSLELEDSELSKVYNATKVTFTPKMYNALNEEISATFTYSYKNLNDDVIDTPINVGTYKVEITGDAGGNYQKVTQTYTFSIVKNKVRVSFSSLNHTYNQEDFKPTVTITLECELNAKDYTIIKYYSGDDEVASTIDVGEYKVEVTLSDTNNFEFVTANKSNYNINQEKLTIAIGNDTSIYGDAIILDEVTYAVTSGTLYTGDDLNITYSKEAGTIAGDYAITGAYNNSNYDVTFINGNYKISKRVISFTFPEYDLTYTANNLIESVVNPSVTNLATGDELIYIISQNSSRVNNVTSAGAYRIALDTSLEILDNYTISGAPYKDFEVKKRELNIVVNDVQRNFSQALSVNDFISSVTGLQGGQGLTDIGKISYSVTLNGTPVEVSNSMTVNDYVINATLNELTALASNYDIKITSGMLHIIEGETYVLIGNEQLSKTYDGNAISLSAGMFTNLDEELIASFTYVYKNLNNDTISAPVNVGTYKVEVTADAGSNYEKATQTYTFSIVKNKVSVSFSNLTHTYDKQDFKPTITITLEGGLIASNFTNIEYYLGDDKVTSTIDVNTYKVVVLLNDVDNFEFVTSSQTNYSITKEQLAVTISNESSIYGDEISLKNVTYTITSGTLYTGDDLGITYTKNVGSYVGNYTIKGEHTNGNYRIDFTFGSYSITKRTISFTFPEYDFTYNGGNQIESLTNPTVNNLAFGDELSYKLYRNNVLTDRMIYTGTYLYSLDRDLKVLDNYEISGSTSKTFMVKQKTLTITPKDMTYYYKHNIDVSSFESNVIGLAGDKITDLGNLSYALLSNGTPVIISNSLSVNDYTLVVSLENQTELAKNYDIKLNTGMLYIVKGETFVVIDGKQFSKTYSGSPVSFEPVMYDDLNNTITASFSYAYKDLNNNIIDAPTNVGKYTVVVTANAGGNYQEATQTYTFSIIKNKVSVSFSNTTHVYNKQDFKPTVKITMQEGLNSKDFTTIKYYSGDDEVTSTINVDTYKVVALLNDVDNFEFVTAYQTYYSITINELKITIGNESSVYGEAISLDEVGYTITSGTLYSGDDLNIVYYKEDGATVGTYAITASYTNSNYDVTFTAGVYTIKANEIELNFSGDEVFTYTGAEFDDLLKVDLTGLQDIVSAWYTDNDGQEVTRIVNVGTYFLKVKLLDADNYTLKNEETSIVTRQIIVNQKVLDLTIEAQNREYNGQGYSEYVIKVGEEELTNDLYSVEYYNGNDKLNSVPVDCGTYQIKIVEKDGHNYKFNNADKLFTIEQVLIELNYGKDDFVYNRNEQKTSVSIVNIVNAGEVSLVLEYTGGNFISVGDYKVEVRGISGTKASNYILPTTGLSCEFSISTAKVSVVYGKLIHTYIGRQLTQTDLNLNFTGDISVNKSDYTISELPTTIGEDYTVEITGLNDNIEFINASADLVIKPATISGITLASVAYPFDGSEKSLSVNTLDLFDGTKASVVYTNNAHINKGEYIVTAVLTNENFKTLTLEAVLTINTREYSVSYVGSSNYIYNKDQQGMVIADISNQSIASLISISYVGVNGTMYESDEAPISVGNYKIIVKSANTDNVTIANPENLFSINPKTVTFKNITNKEVIYDTNSHAYKFDYIGVIDGDDVKLNILYNGEAQLPVNAGDYKVTVGSLGGDEGFDYTYDTSVSAYLYIKAKDINVSAIAKEVAYGAEDVELTYVADDLYGEDEFTGKLERSAGKNVNEYTINIGTLSAGSNYNLVFNSAKYKITQRPITFEIESREFDYDGQEKQPKVTIDNFVYGDTNVAVMNFIGDRINAGIFTGKISILNSNYKLPENYSDVTFTINKKDVTSAIVGLITTSADYTGKVILPMVMIDEVDNQSMNYRLEYRVDDSDVEAIKNAATYSVKIVIDEKNYKGSKEFTFVVNMVDPEHEEIKNTNFMVYSYKIVAPLLDNAMYKLGSGEWVSNNVFDNLSEDTLYVIAIKILATENTNAEDLGEFNIRTGLSAETVNAMFSHVETFAIEHVNAIKLANKSLAKVSEYEIGDVDTEKLSNLVYAYGQYLEVLNSEVVTSNMIAKSTLGNLNIIFYVLNLFTAFIFVLAVIRFRAQ